MTRARRAALASDVSSGRGGSEVATGARPLPRAFWVAGGLLRVAAFIGFMLLFWRVALWPALLFGMFGFFAMTRAMRFGWYARGQRWMMRRGWPDRVVTVVR